GGEDVRLLRSPDLTVVGAARGSAADAEGPAAESPVGGRLQHLDADGLLMGIVLPRQLPEATTRSRVRVAGWRRKCEAGLQCEQHRYRDNEHPLHHKSSFVKELSLLRAPFSRQYLGEVYWKLP